MSDTSQGPGWWQASDGKWYPPDLYPADHPRPDEPASDSAPDAESSGGPPVTDATTVVSPPEHAAPAEPPAAEPMPVQPPDAAPPPFAGSAAPPDWSAATEATTAIPAGPPPGWGQPTPVYTAQPPEAAVQAPPAPAGTNVPAALVALVAAGLAIVGSFLEWATPASEGTVVLPPGIANITVPPLDGLDSNGVGTLVCGAVMALVAGVLLAKVRHVLLTVALVVAGVVAAGLFVYSYVDIDGTDIIINGTAVQGIGFDPGIGLWLVLGGGVLSVIAGLLVKRS